MHCNWSTNFEEALKDDEVNAVIVASPTGVHFEQITKSFEAGKAVFTEKPLGDNLSQIDKCFEMSDKTGLPLFVGFNRRFDKSHQGVAEAVAAGAIGDPHMIKITSRDHPLPPADFIKISGGVYLDCLIHDFDMARFVTGKNPVELFTFASQLRPEYKGIDDVDNVLVTMKYDDGCIVTIDANRYCAYGYDQRVCAFGTKGQIESENRTASSTCLSTIDGLTRPVIHHSFPQRYREGYIREIEAFRDVLNGERGVPVSHEEVQATYKLCILADMSNREKRMINIADEWDKIQ